MNRFVLKMIYASGLFGIMVLEISNWCSLAINLGAAFYSMEQMLSKGAS